MTQTGALTSLCKLTGLAIRGEEALRSRLEQRPDPELRCGDLVVFAESAAYAVEWMVLWRDSESGRTEAQQLFLCVPADSNPLVGSQDVEVPTGSVCGPLSLRCGHPLWIDFDGSAAYRLTGQLETDLLGEARRKVEDVQLGGVEATIAESEVDQDPVYEDWILDGPRQARDGLLRLHPGLVSQPVASSMPFFAAEPRKTPVA